MMPNSSASTSWSAHRPGFSRFADPAPATPSHHATTPPLLTLDEYVSIVSAGPRAMARALGRYVKPPAAPSPEAPAENAPRDEPNDAPSFPAWPDDAAVTEAENAPSDEAAESPWYDADPEPASNEMRWEDHPSAESPWRDAEPASNDAPAETPAPEVMSTLTIPMPTVEDEPPTTASDMTETAPANAPSQPEDQKKDKGARRWSWPWRS